MIEPLTDPILDRLIAADPHQPAVLLHSGRYHPRWARRNLLDWPRMWFRHLSSGESLIVDQWGRPLVDQPCFSGDLFKDLRRLLADSPTEGHWVGYLSYDIASGVEPDGLAGRRLPDHPWPLVELGWCAHPQWTDACRDLSATGRGGHSPEEFPEWSSEVQSVFSPAEYQNVVGRVLAYIAAGDVFQVNLAQRLFASFVGPLRPLFARLASLSPAWYGAYLELPPLFPMAPTTDCPPTRALLSTSPELFLELEGEQILTRPMKGTRPAHVDPAELRDSEKDAAELHMIVDLLRNDLGRVCRFGSVRVDEPRIVETHPTVHQAVATISGQLAPRQDVVDLLRATMPGGSITGAPKVRAMQIIDELEPVPRGPYCGCIGFLAQDRACLSIAIRTIIATARSGMGLPCYDLEIPVGGGIVADSTPQAEYAETLDKAQAILGALGRPLHSAPA
jgi:para-aminobenzoate synthetase component 1